MVLARVVLLLATDPMISNFMMLFLFLVRLENVSVEYAITICYITFSLKL